MSFRSSSTGLQCTTKATSSTTSRSGNSNDSLVIEDLDLADLDGSPSMVKTCSPSLDEIEDEARSLFGEEIPSVMSEACVMNDLYILVRVPTKASKYVPTSSTASQTTPKSPELSPDFCVNSRKIFPIPEEEAESSIQETRSKISHRRRPKSANSCWETVNETTTVEEFISTTSVFRSNDAVPMPNEVHEDSATNHVFDLSQRIESIRATPPQCPNQIELQEVNISSPRFASPTNVALESYGILITPTKAPKTENLLVFQVDTEPKDKNADKSLSCFAWFTGLFRRKRRRNGLVHAKVYKTYFVKWKKDSDGPNCQKCQCGLQPRRSSARF